MSKKTVNELDICPDDKILRDYSAGNVTDDQIQSIIECHLEFCDSCRAAVSEYRNTGTLRDRYIESIVSRLKERQATVRRHEGAGPVPGTIWRAVPDGDEKLFGPLLFVIATNHPNTSGVVLVAEVSEEMAQAIDTDLVLETAESGLPFPFMVRGDNCFLVRRESLKAFAGLLSPELTQRVVDFCCSGGQMGESPAPPEYVFFKDPEGTGLVRRRGVKLARQVFDNGDPRFGFLEAGKRRCSYLHAELDPNSVILRGPLNEPISVTTVEGQKVSAISKLRHFSDQVYHSGTFWRAVNKVWPIAEVLSVAIVALQVLHSQTPQTQAYALCGGVGYLVATLAGEIVARGAIQYGTSPAPQFGNILWYAMILFHFFSAAMLFIIARRTSSRFAWLAFFPGANIFLMLRIANKPLWWALLLLLPLLWPAAAFMQPLPSGSPHLVGLSGIIGGLVVERALILLSLPFDWSIIIPSLNTVLVNPPGLLALEALLILVLVAAWCSVTMEITALRRKSMIWGILLAIPITAPIALPYLAFSKP